MMPQFPLKAIFDDGDVWILETPEEVAQNLEWFDSEDGDTSVVVIDARERPVSVKVEALEIKRLELAIDNPGAPKEATLSTVSHALTDPRTQTPGNVFDQPGGWSTVPAITRTGVAVRNQSINRVE